MKIFISYRRDDSAGYAGRLFDHLTAYFGVDSVFMDIDTIEPGEDFRKVVQTAVGACDVVLVMIGKQWLSIADPEGRRRLDDPRDWVRAEIAGALTNPHVRVIPVLVRSATMPGEHDLPNELKELSWRNAIELSDSRFQHDANKLIGVIERVAGKPVKPQPAPPPKRGAAKSWVLMVGMAGIGLIICLVSFQFLPIVPTATAIAANTASTSLPTSSISEGNLETVLTEPSSTRSIAASPIPSDVLMTPTSTQDWFGVLDVRLPTADEIRAEEPESIWQANNLDVADISSPGRQRYSGFAQVGGEYLFPVYWCAKGDTTLRRNLENIKTILVVDDQVIPDRFVLTYDYITGTGWKCSYNSVVLGGWVAYQQYKLEARRTILAEISDGENTYKAGEYVYEFNVEVR